jgi:hypothetical protein
MLGFGLEAVGHGDGFTRKTAFQRAFAEAWERLWFLRLVGRQLPNVPFFGETTNGFACGGTSEDAIRRSRAEAIERAMLLEAWETMRGWHGHRPNLTTLAFLSALPRRFCEWNWRFFRINSREFPSTLVLVAQHSKEGTVVDSLCAEPTVHSEAKLILSVLRSVAVEQTPPRRLPVGELPEVGAPQDHGIFYRDTANALAFDFLNNEAAGGMIALPSPAKLKSVLVIPPSQFPAVAFSFHPDWTVLKWGRHSIRGVNRWPHPLA